MRQIGSLASQQQAQLLADYLLTEGIAAQAEPDGAEWAVWVREENELEQAKSILRDFLEDPSQAKYTQAVATAKNIRTEQAKKRVKASRNMIDMRRQWNQSLRRRAPLVMVLIGLSVFVHIITAFGQAPQSAVTNTLKFSDIRVYSQTGDGLLQIKHGQVWRLVTPIFLHGDPLHLLFNMYWLYVFGVQIEMRRGTVALGLAVLVMAIISNMAQYLVQGPNFVGMSGVVYGLFGYVWIRSRIDPQAGFLLHDFTVFLLLFFLVLGFAGALGDMANYAHAGGLAVGVAWAFLDPRRR